MAYGSNPEKVHKLLLNIAENIEGIEKDPAPTVYFSKLGDYALEFLIVLWVDNPKGQFIVKTKINKEVYEIFTKENIPIAHLPQDIHSLEKLLNK